MIMGIEFQELLWLALSMLIAGGVTGLLAGLFGVGGGTVAVPVLYELFRYLGVPEDVLMPLSIGTSLAIIIPTSIRSYRAHLARGAVDTSLLKAWAVPVVAGVIAGSVIARYAPAELFKFVFIVVAGVSAIRLLFGKDSWKLADQLPGKLAIRFCGLIIGVLSSLMGIGGGQLSNLFMTFYNRPIHQAVATSSGLGILISIPGALGYIYAGWPRAAQFPDVAALQPPLALGYVSLLGFFLVIPTSILAAPVGVKLAHSLSKRKLEVAFGVFLLLICLRFLISVIY
ncbi:sulfite exporter TauE/SafE family protein (plasmid) [Pseudochrobactrum algeriensis]|nr:MULTISPECIES: sulfite exporter TauE/SafE family protein [Pseudochrobactrum]MBX8812549.1 sulfite exporter TauE/SafE family protein [Ochrobactrum sp. MR34]KAB0538365.1 sulfite exporter TauE/SafE family protein [Pseudochrobactrum saccharolyticum]MDP8250496.1 sulfite exporter TauE/SafE family protein [Pseudochrobactrum saccharolyticum]QVQ35248.1 sulfite exporter TauE/SafE family protein [Pseudochrobactrum algeriensis]QVQ41864.1 sulfite exporter TauE/SafE family protein [Pseudochrobactrum algeri